MADQNQVFRVELASGFPAYFVCSTAPINVDVPFPPEDAGSLRSRLAKALTKQGDGLDAGLSVNKSDLEGLARAIQDSGADNLAFFIHGYNNNADIFLNRFAEACATLADNPRPGGTIFIGYRWPGEHFGLSSIIESLRGAPRIMYALLAVAVGWALWYGALAWQGRFAWAAVVAGFAALFTGVPIGALIFRVSVYYRDMYRARHYGVPDLTDFIRALDAALGKAGRSEHHDPKIALSFVGHSMGTFVVTEAVRVLVDVFRREDQEGQPLAEQNRTEASKHYEGRSDLIGRCFCLGRLVLVAPDIPAETLIAGRANPLLSALRRFQEAYLFSNVGDEVLRQVARSANSFMYPTRSPMFGFRLGNVEVAAADAAPTAGEPARARFDRIRLGGKTLSQLTDRIDPAFLQSEKAEKTFPGLITFFDCTDYQGVTQEGGPKKRLLSWPGRGIGMLWHAALFVQYFLPLPGKVDMHSGYFEGAALRRLIFGLACHGGDGVGDLPETVERDGVRVLRGFSRPRGG